MAHIYSARAVLPGMLARGAGYLLHTASAAGLLTQVGGAQGVNLDDPISAYTRLLLSHLSPASDVRGVRFPRSQE